MSKLIYSSVRKSGLLASTGCFRRVARCFSGIHPDSDTLTLEQLEKFQGPGLDDFLGGFEVPKGKAGRVRAQQQTESSGKNLGQKFKRQPKSAHRKPEWLKMELPKGENYEKLRRTVSGLNLATVCEEAKCPNQGECWGGAQGTATATIMLMGDTCTRACRFCSVKTSRTPPALDSAEPRRVAAAIIEWGLDYVVLTSVDRDDVADGGADHIAQTVEALRASPSSPFVEVLTPDFSGMESSVERVSLSGLHVFAHNMETVRRLTASVRDRRAFYDQSLSVLRYAKEVRKERSDLGPLLTKTSLMLGFGETEDEVKHTLDDLREHNVDVVTFGQYLQPTRAHMKVAAYIHPEMFDLYKSEAESRGFLYVASGPMVRSSYKAGELFLKHYLEKQQTDSEKSADSTD